MNQTSALQSKIDWLNSWVNWPPILWGISFVSSLATVYYGQAEGPEAGRMQWWGILIAALVMTPICAILTIKLQEALDWIDHRTRPE
jgi:hypothetical protein